MHTEQFIILLVEDDPAHAEIVRRNFEKLRTANRMISVPDGQAALDYLYRRADYSDPVNSPRPGIVLLDLRLPKVDGLQVLKMIKEDPSLLQIPVVILTTSASESDITKAYEYRANSYLVKPVDFSQFSSLLDAFGGYWLTLNKYPQT
ncbi:MAG: response regulator [Desulfuromonadales bacterium]|nr:response regulator [Desulfuromonadales bacterium]